MKFLDLFNSHFETYFKLFQENLNNLLITKNFKFTLKNINHANQTS